MGAESMIQPQGRRSILWPVQFVLLNIFFWVNLAIVTSAFVIVGFPYVYLFHKIVRQPRKTSWLIRRSIRRYGLLVMKCGWPFVRVGFKDYAPDETPPFVIVANHRSASDGFLGAFMQIESVQVLNIWPSRVPLIGFLARVAGYLKVREMPFEEFIQAGSKLLSEGVCIIAFPEGTRSGSAQMGNFHGSAFRLAQHNGVKIVPLAISGNEKIPVRGSLKLYPGRITISKLPAITPEQYRDMSPYKLKNFVRERLAAHLNAQPA
jgi:1-acyl-sn-glycerol-3-phosphate acyltransferase